jgi:hypothetical protein
MKDESLCDHCKKPLLHLHNNEPPLPDGWRFAWQTVEGPLSICDYQTICYPCSLLYDATLLEFFPDAIVPRKDL